MACHRADRSSARKPEARKSSGVAWSQRQPRAKLDHGFRSMRWRKARQRTSERMCSIRSNCPPGRSTRRISPSAASGVLDGAQNERRHDRVERRVGHREIVRGGGDHGRSTVRTPHQPPPHGRVRLGEDQLRKARRIVRHVQAGSRADLEHTPACMAEQRTPMVPHPGVLSQPQKRVVEQCGTPRPPRLPLVDRNRGACLRRHVRTLAAGTGARHRPPRPSRRDGRFSRGSEETQTGGLCDRRRA